MNTTEEANKRIEEHFNSWFDHPIYTGNKPKFKEFESEVQFIKSALITIRREIKLLQGIEEIFERDFDCDSSTCNSESQNFCDCEPPEPKEIRELKAIEAELSSRLK